MYAIKTIVEDIVVAVKMSVHTVTYYVNVYIYRNGVFYANVTFSD